MNKQFFISLAFFLSFALSSSLFSQNSESEAIPFEVTKVYPSLSLTSEELKDAECLSDLSRYYKASWIREYKSVQIYVTSYGESMKLHSKDGVLTDSQKYTMQRAEPGSQIDVLVDYIPENNLKQNDIQQIRFSFYVEPEIDAEFQGGLNSLNDYIKTKAIEKISSERFVDYKMVAVKFTVDEEGDIMNVEIFQSSHDDKIDALLIQTIEGMPDWQPAKYADGTPAVQQFALIVGNMQNCMINLLNIDRD